MGQQRLQKAIRAFDGGRVSVEWKPYMIDPGTHKDGEDMEAYCRRRWGSSGWTRNLRTQGKHDGANFANWKWWPHTLKAHQTILYAKDRYGIDTSKSKQALFEALYEEGENISLVDTLVRVARDKLGIPPQENDDDDDDDDDGLRQHLETNQGAQQVQREIELGRKTYRISGVPFFIIDGQAVAKPYAMSGAQDPQTFLEVFQEVSGQQS